MNEYLTDDKIKAFLSYMEDNFPEPMQYPFTRELVENVVRYAYEHHGHSSWSALYMITDIIPEVSYEELEKMLTKFGFKDD